MRVGSPGRPVESDVCLRFRRGEFQFTACDPFSSCSREDASERQSQDGVQKTTDCLTVVLIDTLSKSGEVAGNNSAQSLRSIHLP